MLAGIAGRHVFSDTLPAVTELPEQLFPWWAMVCIVLAARAGQHVAVEAFRLILPPGGQAFLAWLIHIATAVMCAGIVWTLVRVAAVAGGDRSPILGLPLIHLHVALAAGFTLVGILALCELMQRRAA